MDNARWYDVDFTVYGVTDEVDMVRLGHDYQHVQYHSRFNAE